MSVEPARIGQHPQPGVPGGELLRSQAGPRPAERRPVGGDADHRQPPRAQPRGLGQQRRAAVAQFLRGELVGPGGGAVDDVGDAQAQAEQLLLLVGPQLARGETGLVQGRPEAVPRPGEVVPGGGGVQAGVDPGEQDAQAGRDDVGDGQLPGRGQLGRRRAGAGRGRSPAAETRFALVDEGPGGLTVVLGEPGVHMVGHFEVQALAQLAGHRPVQVLLHVAVGDRRPLGQPASPRHDLLLEVRRPGRWR